MKFSPSRFKNYKSDAAPFFFYLDIFPLSTSPYEKDYLKDLISKIKQNFIIMPIPMRVDKVYNGQKSVMLRPLEPIHFKIQEDLVALINPQPFLQKGINNLVQLSEVRSLKVLHTPIESYNIQKWWNQTRFIYANSYQLEQDFSAFLKAYLNFIVKAKFNDGDLKKAAENYCQMIVDICEKRINFNSITTEVEGEIAKTKIYVKKTKKVLKNWKFKEQVVYHPELIDIELFDFKDGRYPESKENLKSEISSKKSEILKYIPFMIYDDLLECMLQNLVKLERDENDILDPSILINKNIIKIYNSEEFPDKINLKKFSWLDPFESVNINRLIDNS